jgi:4-hydroxy-tetrahydrodipicolinate synthase
MLNTSNRRGFLKGASALLALSATGIGTAEAASVIHKSPSGKPLAGVFPIGWSPQSPDGKFSLDAMVAQQKFLNRGKVAGMAWPQNASGWQTLSSAEWHAGADALLSVKGDSAVLLGVQSLGFDLAKSIELAKYAGAKGADGIVSLTPVGGSDAEIIAYFKALGAASKLPMVVQAVGPVTVDTLIALHKAVPDVVAVKDETGDPLQRSAVLIPGTGGTLSDWSGAGGHTFFPELELGFQGTCPYVGMSDVLQQCYELHTAGKRREAYDMFGRFMAFNSLPKSNQYVLVARGVFSEDLTMRVNPPAPGATQREPEAKPTEREKALIKTALDTYLKPYLRA